MYSSVKWDNGKVIVELGSVTMEGEPLAQHLLLMSMRMKLEESTERR